MQRGHDGLGVRAGGQCAATAKVVQPGGLFGAIRFELVGQGSGQQAELMSQPDMITGEISGAGWQVVSGDGGQAVLAPPFGA